MRTAPRLVMLAAVLTGAVATVATTALAQNGAAGGSSGRSTAGPGTAVRPASTTPAPAGLQTGTAAEQTHPWVLPRAGGPHTRFTASLTLADAPGHSGVLASDYRLQLRVERRQLPRRCLPPTPPDIGSGSANQRVDIPLTAPDSGWCSGRYTLTVFLQRGPYCPAPLPGQPPPPCPEFATQELDVGHANFVVTARH